VSAKESVTHQKRDAEDEHLHRQEPEHSRRNCEAGSFANVARDLGELDSGEGDFLARQVSPILRDFAQDLANSAI